MTGMPRPLFDREAIEAEISRVRSLGLDALRTLWRVTFRSSPPPAFSKVDLPRKSGEAFAQPDTSFSNWVGLRKSSAECRRTGL